MRARPWPDRREATQSLAWNRWSARAPVCVYSGGVAGRGLGRLRGRTPAPWRSTLGSLGTAMGTGPGTVAAAPRPAVGGGRGRRRPHRATSQTRETVRHLWSPSAPLRFVPLSRVPLRGAAAVCLEKVRCRTNHSQVSPDSVSPQSLFVNRKLHAGRIHSSRGVVAVVERKSPGLPRVAFPRSL